MSPDQINALYQNTRAHRDPDEISGWQSGQSGATDPASVEGADRGQRRGSAGARAAPRTYPGTAQVAASRRTSTPAPATAARTRRRPDPGLVPAISRARSDPRRGARLAERHLRADQPGEHPTADRELRRNQGAGGTGTGTGGGGGLGGDTRSTFGPWTGSFTAPARTHPTPEAPRLDADRRRARLSRAGPQAAAAFSFNEPRRPATHAGRVLLRRVPGADQRGRAQRPRLQFGCSRAPTLQNAARRQEHAGGFQDAQGADRLRPERGLAECQNIWNRDFGPWAKKTTTAQRAPTTPTTRTSTTTPTTRP